MQDRIPHSVETTYDNIVDELYPDRDPLEIVSSIVKKAAVLAGIAVLCLYTMKVGNEDAESVIPEEDGSRVLNISIVDELSPESKQGSHDRDSEKESSKEGTDDLQLRFDWKTDWVYLIQEDGSTKWADGTSIVMNTARCFMPDSDLDDSVGFVSGAFKPGSFGLGTLRYSQKLYGEEEWEFVREDSSISGLCIECNPGADIARQLIKEGYLNEMIMDFLDGFPDIRPYERTYSLRFEEESTKLWKEGRTREWNIEYLLYTKTDNGEELAIASVDVYRTLLFDGEPETWNDARYQISAITENLWQLTADPAADKGQVCLGQVAGDAFANEESVRQFVEEQGAAFLLPEGVDTAVEWDSCRRQEVFYYDYLIWQGETADYEIILAVPLMEKKDEGYYLASRIRKEAEDKASCYYLLSGMIQTLRSDTYLHVVREGESLSKIAKKYMGGQTYYPKLQLYNEDDGTMEDFADPDFIYPGQKVYVPRLMKYGGWM